MLIYNLERVYKARGIEKPYSFFKGHGFSDSFAAKLKKGKMSGMKLSTLEAVCILLQCTPHDLLEWKEDSKINVAPDHPIRKLESRNSKMDMTVLLRSAPLEVIEKFTAMIDEDVPAMGGTEVKKREKSKKNPSKGSGSSKK